MTSIKDDDERERLSWSEIDKLKDRSRHVTPEPKRREKKKESESIRKEALKQAEMLFRGKRSRPEYKKALIRLESHQGTPKFQTTAKKFLGEYGLPEDWSTLTLLLDYQEPAKIQEILTLLRSLAASRSRVEQQGFKGKLRTLALTAGDEGLKQAATTMLAELPF